MRDALLYALILGLGLGSYAWGARDIVRGRYLPSVFSRAVWLVLAGVSFAGVIGSDGSTAAALLAGTLLAGNGAICGLSVWRGTREFARMEAVCLVLSALSVGAWIIFDSALVGLVMSLATHLIGAIPTLGRAWRDARTESTGFWSLFFAASALSLLASAGGTLEAAILPLYFTVFDGLMFALSLGVLRRRRLGG
jgi:hypothetical protein